MEPHDFEKLGGKESGLIYEHVEGSAAIGLSHPDVFTQANAWSAPIYYQGKRPACGAHALAFAKTLLDMNDGKPNVQKSPRFSWIDMKEQGSDKNPSDGVDMTALAQSGMNTGVDDYEPLENDVTYDDVDYAAPHFITPAMLAAAKANQLADFKFVRGPFTMDGLKQLIYDHKAVIALLRVGTSLWQNAAGQTDWGMANVCPLRPPASIVDAHFEVMHSYDQAQIWMANSFGATYGRNGHNSFNTSYLPYIYEVGIPVNPPVPAPVILPPLPPVLTTDQVPVVSAIQYDQNALQTAPQSQQEGLQLQINRLVAFLLSFINGKNPNG